jgi:hypothetical protein
MGGASRRVEDRAAPAARLSLIRTSEFRWSVFLSGGPRVARTTASTHSHTAERVLKGHAGPCIGQDVNARRALAGRWRWAAEQALQQPRRAGPGGDEHIARDLPSRIPQRQRDHGEIQPVPLAVWDYQVADTRVIRHWFRYRTGEPTDRYPTELDAIPLGRWDDLMIKVLLNLLNVLGFLVELALTQQAVVDHILRGPCVSVDELVGSAAIPAPPGAVGPLVSEGPQAPSGSS